MLVKGKVALVTGGASGIGLACIEEMLKNDIMGSTLVDINEQNGIAAMNDLNKRYGQGKVIFVKANVANKNEFEGAFKKTIETFKQLDIFFNNAGTADETNYENCVDVNLKGAIHGLKLAIDNYLPKYRAGKDSIIINTASVVGLLPCNGVEIYSTTKFGVIGLTKNFGCDYHYGRTGVKVVAICPSATDTPNLNQGLQNIFYRDRMDILNVNAASKVQTPEQLAKCFIRIVEKENNGSIWVIAEGKESMIEFPELLKL